MATKVLKDPVRSSARDRRAGALVPLSGRRQKHIASAGGVSVQAVSQWKGGANYGPFYEAVAAADRLGRLLACDRTDPYPAIVEMEVVVIEASLSHWSDEDLVREWRRLYETEPGAQADEDAASARFVFTRDLLDLAAAHKREAAHQIRFAAVCELLDRRGIDPIDPEWNRLGP
jgi:hypothetical protein